MRLWLTILRNASQIMLGDLRERLNDAAISGFEDDEIRRQLTQNKWNVGKTLEAFQRIKKEVSF